MATESQTLTDRIAAAVAEVSDPAERRRVGAGLIFGQALACYESAIVAARTGELAQGAILLGCTTALAALGVSVNVSRLVHETTSVGQQVGRVADALERQQANNSGGSSDAG